MAALKPPSVLLNALHTTTGGGLVYLQNLLPYLATDRRFAFTLLAPQATLKKLKLPKGIKVWEAPSLGFGASHVYEQLALPFLARGFSATWCNANFTPLLTPQPLPTLHTTPRAALQAQGAGMKLYWWCLRWLTVLSVWRAPAAFSVAHHVIADYVGPRLARKVRVASPAAPLFTNKPRKVPNLVVAVGDYYPQKNYPQLLRAFKVLQGRLPEARLEIIGRPVNPEVAQMVKQLITDLNLKKSVKEMGPLPHAKLMTRLAAAGAFVNLSTAECFNMPVLEALAAGTPVVTGDSAFQREVAADAAVYVPLNKGGDVASAVAVALYGVLQNPVISAMLTRAGKARAAAFSWQKTAQIIGDTLAAVVRQPASF